MVLAGTNRNRFTTLKDKLTCAPVTLAFPNWHKGFVLQVDASTQAVGGILLRKMMSKSLDRLHSAYSDA